jgi:CHRD domain
MLAVMAVALLGATPALADDHPMSMPMPSDQTTGSAATQPAASAAAYPAVNSITSRIPLFLTADLSGAQEVQVPGKPRVGDPDGHATAQVEVVGSKVIFSFRWSGISAPTMGHIHEGVKGVNGPIVVPFFTTAMPDTATAAAGAVTVNDPSIATGIRSNPSGFYVNLHTAAFPGGAVRGQLVPARHPLDLLNVVSGGPERAFLAGDQEVQVAGKPLVGDPDGRAIAFIRPGARSVSYSFAWVGVRPTLGHIHEGAFGANGPVVVPLFMTPVPSSIFALSGTAPNVDPELIAKIRDRPTDFYANLHTAQFPGGAVRGQLFH